MDNVVGMNLYLLRKNANKTQRTIEKDLNLGEHTWSYYENGQRNIPNELLNDIAKYFKVTVDYLFTAHEEEIQKSIERVLATKDINIILEQSDLWQKYLKAEDEIDYSWRKVDGIDIPDCCEDIDSVDYYDDALEFVDHNSVEDYLKDYSKIVSEYEEELIHGNTEVLERLIKTQYDWTRQDKIFDRKNNRDLLDTIEATFDEIDDINKILTYCMIARHHLLSFLEKCYGI